MKPTIHKHKHIFCYVEIMHFEQWGISHILSSDRCCTNPFFCYCSLMFCMFFFSLFAFVNFIWISLYDFSFSRTLAESCPCRFFKNSLQKPWWVTFSLQAFLKIIPLMIVLDQLQYKTCEWAIFCLKPSHNTSFSSGQAHQPYSLL